MKHNIKITILLLAMFLATQFIGLAVISAYNTTIEQRIFNQTTNQFEKIAKKPELPYGMQPPEMSPEISFTSIALGMIIATVIIFLLCRIRATFFLKFWFFSVVTLSIAIVFNAPLSRLNFLSGPVPLLAFILAFPFAFYKIFERGIILHNITELLVYPGIAAVFVPILNLWTAMALLALIAIYDVYAVWHSGFMQKLAKFQIQQLRVFTGFFVPYIAKKDRARIDRIKMLSEREREKRLKKLKIRVNLAILGGGDITFPLIFAGVVLRTFGLARALLVPFIAAIALLLLFAFAKKGKFYPAMLFLSPACIIAWLVGLVL